MTSAWAVPAGLQSWVSSSFQWSIDSCQFARKKIQNISPAARETPWKEEKITGELSCAADSPLVELQLLCQQWMKFVMSQCCFLTCEIISTLSTTHRGCWAPLLSPSWAAVPATPTTLTIDINWHPCSSLQGEAKDLMGTESELLPRASRWDVQGQARARLLSCHLLGWICCTNIFKGQRQKGEMRNLE